MKEIPLNKHTIISKLDEIQRDVEKLKKFQSISYEEFKGEENFAIAEHYLRRALEALFEIGAHILSRIPGARITSYKEIAKNLGQYKIVSSKFSEETLIKMAGYRNRLIHFYSEITTEEMHKIIC